MVPRTLSVTFEGPGTHSGVPLEDFQKTLRHVQAAVRLTVEHLSDLDVPQRGRPSKSVREGSELHLCGITLGSLVVELELPPPKQERLWDDNVGPQALAAILSLDSDGNGAGSVPPSAVDQLRAICTDLSSEVDSVWLGDASENRRLQFKRETSVKQMSNSPEVALLYGWLKEVNWEKNTARLYDMAGEYVNLRFDPSLDVLMQKLATQYVEVSGTGRFNDSGEWITVSVDRIDHTRSSDQPFDIESALEQARDKVFNPEAVITTSEPFDVDDFIDIIHRARDVDDELPQAM
ncbi:hypothetical protein [Candidatus Poriferisocius sp.]|uniref:hypothetical protein n=1 Tax=Candidatus Poriferisocius sp. TaxID=3101276 RepID=UPI003B02CC2C